MTPTPERDAALYRIRRWEDTFLSAKTRGRVGRLKYLLIPVKLDDLDYIALMARPDGTACLGVWLALLEVAGSMEARDGFLCRSCGEPFTVSELSQLTRIPVDTLKSGIAALVEVRWLVVSNDSERCGSVRNDEESSPPERSGAERRGARAERSGEAPRSPLGQDNGARPLWPGRSAEWDRCLEIMAALGLDPQAQQRLCSSPLDDPELYRMLADVRDNRKVKKRSAYVVSQLTRMENAP